MREELEKLLEKTRSISYEYEVTRLIFIFLGGAITIVVTQFLGFQIIDMMSQISQQYGGVLSLEDSIKAGTFKGENVLQLEDQLTKARQTLIGTFFSTILLAGIVFFIPILLSLILTKASSINRIIPPSFMQIIVFSYFIIFFTFSQETTKVQPVPSIMLMTIYTIFAGIGQTSFVTWIMGIKASDTDLIKYSLKIHTTIRDLENFLTSEPIRGDLFLKRSIEETRNGILLKSIDKIKYTTWIEVVETNKDDEVFLNMVNFEEGIYELKKSPRLEGFAIKQFLYLKNKLADVYPPIRYEEVSETNANRLAEEVLEENKGVYSQIGGISKMTIFKTFLFVLSGGLIGYLYYIGDSTNAILGALTVFLYLVFELTRFTRHRLSLMKTSPSS